MIVDMPPLKWTRPQGDEARASILVELLRREQAGEQPPTLRELGELLGVHRVTVREHLVLLREAGLVIWQPRKWRTLALTDAGRMAAELVD